MDDDIFSERERNRHKPDTYPYQPVPNELRNQIIYVLNNLITVLKRGDAFTQYWEEEWASIWNIYCRIKGLPPEINDDRVAESYCRQIIAGNDTKATFDIIEIAFRFIKKQNDPHNKLQKATENLNNYFQKASFDYQLIENRIVRIEDYPTNNIIYTFYGTSTHGYKGYEYFLPQNPNMIPAVPGNYMFATWRNNGWQVLYVGESENLQNRLVNNRHEKINEYSSFAHPDKVYILYDANRWNKNERRKAERDIINSLSPSPFNFQDSTENDKNTQLETIDFLIRWFHGNYQHPEVELPYDKEEGKYIFVDGGPYDANDVLTKRFPGLTEEIIKAAVKKIESDGVFEWSPIQHKSYNDTDKLTNKSGLDGTHKVIRDRLTAAQNATPLAESVEWNSSKQKIRITPAPVNNTVLWEGDLERLHDEILDIKNKDEISNSHAPLIQEVERLETRLEKYKNSPQQIHDEMEITLRSVQRIENEEEVTNDVHTQRFKEILEVCILDIRGDVPRIQEVIGKREKMRLTQLSESEQDLLTSITEKVIPYIEEEQIKQDMQQDVEAFKEYQNVTDSQEKTFKSYRWISRLSRILPLLMEKVQNFWQYIEPIVISKTIEAIISKIFGP